MTFVSFEEMNALQRRLHNAAIVLDCEGDEHGFVELLRETIVEIELMRNALLAARPAFSSDSAISKQIDAALKPPNVK